MQDTAICAQPPAVAPQFSRAERLFLLQQPGIGASVILRLEQVGITSIAELRSTGVTHAVATVCTLMGNVAWVNRQRPLERALMHYAAD